MVKVYDTDTPEQIAKKIFYDFDVHASVTIEGFYRDEDKRKLIPKGEVVLEQIKRLDKLENHDPSGRRRIKFRANSIGGPIAHKIFTFEKKVVDSEIRYTIWRFQ